MPATLDCVTFCDICVKSGNAQSREAEVISVTVHDDLGQTTDTWEQVEAVEGPSCASDAWRKAAGIAPSFN